MTTTLGAPTVAASIPAASILPAVSIPLPPTLEVLWPQPAVQEALEQVDLLGAWLERRVEQQLEALLQPAPPETAPPETAPPETAASLDQLRHHWFGEQAASLFLSRRRELEQVLLSVLQLDDGHLAQELWFRLQAGEADFASLSQLNIGPERQQGCRIGPVAMAHLDAELVHLLERCQPGELAPPLERADGSVLLLRLDQRSPARLDPDTRQALEFELYRDWLQQQLQSALAARPVAGQPLRLVLPAP